MTAQRFPHDLVITEKDFNESGWKAVLSEMSREGYSSMWQAFSTAAGKAMEEGRHPQGKVLWLLADACSMMLSPQSQNEPFKPIMVMDGRRSPTPEDFSDADIAFFGCIVDLVDDAALKGRIADIVWIKQKPRAARFALAAIDAYRAMALDTETWVRGGRECWERALGLVRMLGRGAGDRLTEMQAAIINAFDSATPEDGYLAIWLAELLKSNSLCPRHHQAAIAGKLASHAKNFDAAGDLHRARDYFFAAADWYRAAGDESGAAEMVVAYAEGWVKEAIARTSTEQPSHMVAASFYENAIQAYRTIPRSERSVHRVDQRVAELRVHLSDSGEKSLDEMGVVESDGIDISEIVKHARDAVSGKSPVDALKVFANLHGGTHVKKARESAIERLGKHPLQAFFQATVISRDGRVIAKRPGMSFGSSPPSDDDEVVIRAEMVRDHGMLMGIVVQGDILPALEVLHQEQYFREADFIALARQSPLVPPGREGLFGKALFMGYDTDYASALHLLVPQIEHMVRFHLKQAGVKTTNLDIDGIENENGLSTLMALPEADKVFGEDLAFDIRSLFCDAFGPNLRNELAHGLLDDDACQSAYAIYAWWFGLKLVFNVWWNATRRQNSQDGSSSDEVANSEG